MYLDCPMVASASSFVLSQLYIKKEVVEDDSEKFPRSNEDKDSTSSISEVLLVQDDREIAQTKASSEMEILEAEERNERGHFNCKVCTYTTSHSHNFAMHSLSEHGIGGPIKCGRSFRCFKRYFDYKNHLMPISKRFYQCRKCKIGFFRPKELNAHVERHRKYGNNSKLINKFTSFNPNDCNNFRQISRTERKCGVCSEQFSCYFDLQQHMASSHSYSDCQFKCDICILPFASQKQFNRHLAEFHPIVKRCMKCNKQFRFISEIRGHMGVHSR